MIGSYQASEAPTGSIPPTTARPTQPDDDSHGASITNRCKRRVHWPLSQPTNSLRLLHALYAPANSCFKSALAFGAID